MTIENIYETALYLAEKCDDSTGFVDNEYKNQHKMKAKEIIKQGIIKLANIENVSLPMRGKLDFETEVPLSSYITGVVLPCYTAAILCQQDGEMNKYNLLIYEYEKAVGGIKHDEEAYELGGILEGLV